MLAFGSKYSKFWKWFQAREDEGFHVEKNQEEVFDMLAGRLCRVGEYDFETKIAGIEFVEASASQEKRRMPLRELAGVVDGLPKTVQ